MALRTPTMNPVEALVAALRGHTPEWRHGARPYVIPQYVTPPGTVDPMPTVTRKSIAEAEALRRRRERLFQMGARDPSDTEGTI